MYEILWLSVSVLFSSEFYNSFNYANTVCHLCGELHLNWSNQSHHKVLWRHLKRGPTPFYEYLSNELPGLRVEYIKRLCVDVFSPQGCRSYSTNRRLESVYPKYLAIWAFKVPDKSYQPGTLYIICTLV